MSLPVKKLIITGSHHTPAIELIRQLRHDPKNSWQIHYIAHLSPGETHLKNTIIPKLKVLFHPLNSGKYDRRWLPNTLTGIPKIFSALIRSFFLVRRLQPSVCVAFGGYVSVPVVIASWLNRLPIIIHEQTLTASLTTKISHLFSTKTALSFHISSLSSPKTVITGNLLRREIFSHRSPTFAKLQSLIKTKPLLYITGGSQGASAINSTILPLLPRLLSRFTIIHHTGNFDFDQFQALSPQHSHYYPVKYIGLSDIGWVLNHSTVIISRAGANTCQEIAALHRRAILIPLPQSQQDEQLKNAFWLKKELPDTIILSQSRLNPESLFKAVTSLSRKPFSAALPQKTNLSLLHLIHEIVA